MDAANQDLTARTTYRQSHIGSRANIIDEILRREPVFSRLAVSERDACVSAERESAFAGGDLLRRRNDLDLRRLGMHRHAGE